MAAVTTLAPAVGTTAACEALGVVRTSYYRDQARHRHPLSAPRRR